jgi:2,3,4,5-tetrahydropyridine-2-carboxylate N-succinyltransferase
MANQTQQTIEQIWERRDNISDADKVVILSVVEKLDAGELSVVSSAAGGYALNEYLKKTILLMFRIYENKLIQNGDNKFYDKIPLKFDNWNEAKFKESGIRVLPSSIVRISAYLAQGVVVMSGSTINVGARIGKNSMVDSGATIGSCAYIGENTHISMNVGIGGVLEPLQENPVIIGDNCFIGPAAQVVEGVRVENGAVITGGLVLSKSTPIYDSVERKWIEKGIVPAGAVVVPGSKKLSDDIYQQIALIIKYSDEITKTKVAINATLHQVRK